jgi:hypothetical protein
MRSLTLLLLLVVTACNRTPGGERVALAMNGPNPANAADTVVVYKSPTCGCCNAWVDHVREHGFTVVTHDMNDVDPIKRQLNVPPAHISCHTASVRGYAVEGHVPADLIRKMLDEKPGIRGLTVPGMPVGSPGMEGPFKQAYDVLSFDDAGNVQVYAKR